MKHDSDLRYCKIRLLFWAAFNGALLSVARNVPQYFEVLGQYLGSFLVSF